MDFIHNVPIKVPNKSGFDLSHEHCFTGKTGQLLPVLVHELLPNDTVSLGSSFQVQLPPSVTDFYGRVDFYLEAFFVPNRLCWGGWKDFITHPTSAPQYPEFTPVAAKPRFLPSLTVSYRDGEDFADRLIELFGNDTLFPYLGFKINDFSEEAFYDTESTSFKISNILPFVAYHRIYDDWYRDTRIQAPLFYSPLTSEGVRSVGFLPYISGISVNSGEYSEMPFSLEVYNGSELDSEVVFTDGKFLGDFRYRNWSKDYFTSASPYPQASVVGGRVTMPVADEQTVLSIAALRSANSLQQWLERNNLAGYRYADQIHAQFGRYPADAIMDRPIYLGRIKQAIYTRSVFQQSNSEAAAANPFNSIGAKYGSPQCVGDGSLIDSFTSSEHGFLMVFASLVPHAYYSTGVSRILKRSVVGDFAFPLLANMGDQQINKSELSGSLYTFLKDSGFGYTDLYAEYKVINDHVTGLLADGNSLSSFALQRSFGDNVELGSDFLKIDPGYLDQVLTVTSEKTGLSYWADVYFAFKKVSTLPVYSQPTLMDLQNGRVTTISRGGSRL